MSILYRYVLREYLVPLGYCLAGFISIYVLFELFGSFSRLMEAKLPLSLTVRYFFGYMAPFFHYLAPAALMLAALYTMWNFCRQGELVAMRASGVSFLSIAAPILSVAVAMAALVAWVNEEYVPAHAQWAKRLRAERFDLKKVKRAAGIAFRNAKDGRTWSVGSAADPFARHLFDVKVVEDRPGGSRLYSVTAEKADWLDGEWWFTNPRIIHYDTAGAQVASKTQALDALPLRVFPDLRERPDDLMAQNRDWQYNSVRSKLRYLRKNNDISPERRRDGVYEAWAQIMSPLACIVITLFAIPAGIASGRQSVFRGIVGALVMFFAFYALVIGGMVGSNLGLVPPIPAAVLPHVIFLALGVRAFRKQR